MAEEATPIELTMPRTRSELLSLLRSEPFNYGGQDNIVEVKSFMADNEIEIADDNGALDIDAIWKKTILAPVVKFSRTEDDRAADIVSKAGKLNRQTSANVGNKGGGLDRVSIAKKAYDMKIRAGTARFPDADQAEAAGAFLRLTYAYAKRIDNYAQKRADLEICEKVGSIFNPSTGGVLVNQDYIPDVLWATEEYGIARRVADVVTMRDGFVKQPRRTGIVTMAPIGENPTITATDNSWDLVELTAKEWGVLVRLPSALLEDAAVSVVDEYASSFREAQMVAEDSAFFIGDGTATYNNITGLATALTAAASASAYISASGNAWSAITEADINKLPGSVENVRMGRCVFICSRQFYFQVMYPIVKAAGGATMGEKFNINGMTSQSSAMYNGFPVYFSQVMPTVSASASVCLHFGDYVGGAMIGDRRQLTVATSDQAYFANNQYAIRATSRFTVNIFGTGRGNTFGNMVALKTT